MPEFLNENHARFSQYMEGIVKELYEQTQYFNISREISEPTDATAG
jgi:hypothetical protein